MKRTLFTCIALAVFVVVGLFDSTAALAQRGPNHHRGSMEPGERLERHLQWMDERLDLSDDQEAQIRSRLEEHAAEMRAWREEHESATREDRRDHMRDSMGDLRDDVKADLTDEQIERLEAVHQRLQERREDRRQNRRDMRRHRRHHMKGNLFEQLDLSDEQKEQLRRLRQEFRVEMQQWREQNPEATPEDRRESMLEQADAHRSAMAEILTDEQRRRLEELRSEWRERREERMERREGWRERREEKRREWRERHRQKDDGSASEQEGAEQGASESRFELENYPNPFNPSTEIRFNLPESGVVELSVYDAQGREVESLLNDRLSAGAHSVTFEARDLPSGVYLYRLSFGGQVESGRMTLAK